MFALLVAKLFSDHMPHHSLKLCFLIWIALTALACRAVCPSLPNPASVAHPSLALVLVISV